MKKETVTEEKVINTPAGGVLIGKDKEGQTIIPNDGSLGGFLTGKLHKDGGIKAIVKSTGQPIEMQANEIVITAPAVADTTKRNFQGKMMTNREILSKINVDGGGLAFADGGEMPSSFKPKGKKYTYGGKLMSDSDILKQINDCGCEHDSEDSKKKMKYGGNLSKGMTLGDIANRHNVSLKHINEQLLMGVEKEKEHGGTKAERIAIAKDHLVENPNYYSIVEKAGLESGGSFDSKPFLDYYHSEIAEFLKEQNNIKLDDDYTFRYKGEKFTVQPMVLVDKESDESIKKADFVITDSEDEEVGEITFDSSKKKKFEANSDFFEWNQFLFYNGGELQRKEDLVKDAKNGNSPSRDLNNYNDLVDVQEDGVVGNHVDFPEQGASGASVAFADGGDISFLNDVDKIFDGGGSTGGTQKPNVDYVTIVTTHATTNGVDKYKELVGKSFIDWTSLKAEIRKAFKEQERFIGAFTIQINDNQKAKIFIKFDNKKNTVANFNPLTGVFSDFKKQAVRNQPTTFNSFDWNNFQSSNNKEQPPNTKGSESSNTPSSAKPVLEYLVVTNDATFPELKYVKISSLFQFYNILLDSVKEGELNLFSTELYTNLGREYDYCSIFFRTDGQADYNTFITKGTTFQDFKKFFLALAFFKDSKIVGNISEALNADKFISGGAGAKAGEAKSSDKEVVKSLVVYEILGSQKDSKDIVGFPRYEIDAFYSLLKDFAEKHKDCHAVRVEINSSLYETHRFTIVINKTSLPNFDFETKNLDDFKKHILTRVNYKTYKELRSDFDFTSFFGEESEKPSGEAEQSSSTKPVLESVQFFNKSASPKSNDKELTSLSKLYVALLKNSEAVLKYFDVTFKLEGGELFSKDLWFKTEGRTDEDDTFITTGTTFEDFKKFFLQLPINKKGEKGSMGNLVNTDKFIGTENGDKAREAKSSEKEPAEEPKEESKPQEVADFELERKYLFTRINALSKELDFKRPSLTNEEIGFYSREINKLILKLRKVTEKQESLKPISERLKAVYSVKWGEYNKEYPETTLMSVNGSKSQLTESEYQTVRNFEFKSFFGDWEKAYLENNPSSASQIINPETKEPLAVFHGTDTLFTDWKTYATNNAHYFSKKRSFANWFASSWEARSDKAGVDSRVLKQLNPNRGRFVYRCFLDIRKPVDFSRFGVEKRPVKEFLMFLKINYGIGDYDFWTGLGNASAVTAETQVYAWQIIRLWQNFTMYIKAYTTYDGYIFYEYNPDTPSGGLDNASLCFCAFESSQVKFADAYEFSALSNDSRFNFGGEI